MKPIARITKKVLEFLGCVACLGMKFWTDIEARRIFYTRQKYSREWSLLNSIFWNLKGDAFAWITYGSYSLVTLFFGISICIDSRQRPVYAEKIFLLIGSLMFFGVGALVFAAIDQVPDELIDNAVILGVLSFFVAFLFLIDMSEKMSSKAKTDATQTDTNSIDRNFSRSPKIGTVNSELNLIDHDENDRRNTQNQSIRSRGSSVQNVQSDGISSKVTDTASIIANEGMMNDFENQGQSHSINKYHIHTSLPNHEHIHEGFVTSDVVRAKTYPTIQMPTKVKQYPTIVNHFESEPYKKILHRSTQQQPSSYTRYHDQTQIHNDMPTYYDDFSKFRHDTYYQGPKVDQLMVIRDYSNEPHSCNCQTRDNEKQDDNVTVKSGYVSQVAKLWDDRTKKSQDQESIPYLHKNTNV
ncbi:hypothetical protein ACKWTF_007410 [Chironomus riparius]